MPKISLFLPCRIGTKYSFFEKWFSSLISALDDPSKVEVLIKFDEDEDLAKPLATVEEYKQKGLLIKYIITPRGRGYQDISFFYAQLFLISDPHSKMFMAGSIDLVFKKKSGFDSKLLEADGVYSDNIYVIHPNYVEYTPVAELDPEKATQNCETFPVWSRRWIEICGGHFGYSSSNDGHTSIIEYYLRLDYAIDRRVDISAQLLLFEDASDRSVNREDAAKYWLKTRKTAILTNISEQNLQFAKQAARNLALNIANSWSRDDYILFLTNVYSKQYEALFLQPNISPTNYYYKIKKYRKLTVYGIPLGCLITFGLCWLFM